MGNNLRRAEFSSSDLSFLVYLLNILSQSVQSSSVLLLVPSLIGFCPGSCQDRTKETIFKSFSGEGGHRCPLMIILHFLEYN